MRRLITLGFWKKEYDEPTGTVLSKTYKQCLSENVYSLKKEICKKYIEKEVNLYMISSQTK